MIKSVNRINSPYSASLTGCAFQFYEFMRILPLLMSEDAGALLKEEIQNNNLLQVNSLSSRDRFVVEFKRRYNAVSHSFWEWVLTLNEQGQRAALFYAILKTYKLAFDFQFNVVVKRYNSVERSLTKSDLLMEFNEISACDEFVNGWSEKTKAKIVSQFMTILRQTGELDDKTGELHQLRLEDADYRYYLASGEEWFLTACLLSHYEINEIKSRLI